MGVWGAAISSNDTYADVYDEFFALYDEGLDVAAVSKKLLDDNSELMDHDGDRHNFWFAVAKAQWECKHLDAQVLATVRQIVDSGADLAAAKLADADDGFIKKRKAALEKFLTLLQTEKPKPRVRKKTVIRQPPFEKGACLTFRLENGNYGGAVVLEAIRDTEFGHCLIAATRLNQTHAPTQRDFEGAEVLVVSDAKGNDAPVVMWYLPVRYKQVKDLITCVAVIGCNKTYSMTPPFNGMVGDFGVWIIEAVLKQFELEKTKSKPKRLMVRDLTGASRWRFW